MEKPVRNAVRCFLIENDKVVCIQNKINHIGYYDIPGGKIENNETEEQAVIREFEEESGLIVKNPISRGTIYVNYPTRSFVLHTYIAHEYSGEIKQFEENNTYWMTIQDLISKQKRFANTIMLEPSFFKVLLDETKTFVLNVDVDDDDNVLNLDFKVQRKEA